MQWIPAAGAEEALADRAALAEALVAELDEELAAPLPGADTAAWRSPAKDAFIERLSRLQWELQEARRHLSSAAGAVRRMLAAAEDGE